MKKTLFLFFLLLFIVGCREEDNDGTSEGSVYICTGNGAYAYHKNNTCSGLNNCQGNIVSTTLKEAKKERSACKICYK